MSTLPKSKSEKFPVFCREKNQIKDSYDFLLMRSRVKKYIRIVKQLGLGLGLSLGTGDWKWELENGNGKMEMGKWEIESTPIPSPRR